VGRLIRKRDAAGGGLTGGWVRRLAVRQLETAQLQDRQGPIMQLQVVTRRIGDVLSSLVSEVNVGTAPNGVDHVASCGASVEKCRPGWEVLADEGSLPPSIGQTMLWQGYDKRPTEAAVSRSPKQRNRLVQRRRVPSTLSMFHEPGRVRSCTASCHARLAQGCRRPTLQQGHSLASLGELGCQIQSDPRQIDPIASRVLRRTLADRVQPYNGRRVRRRLGGRRLGSCAVVR
jgi:hypothetical protein